MDASNDGNASKKSSFNYGGYSIHVKDTGARIPTNLMHEHTKSIFGVCSQTSSNAGIYACLGYNSSKGETLEDATIMFLAVPCGREGSSYEARAARLMSVSLAERDGRMLNKVSPGALRVAKALESMITT